MRLRITQRLSGSIDGRQLSQFELGEAYDVGTSIGSYLLAVGAAEPVQDDEPASVVPICSFPPKEHRHRSTPTPRLTNAADSSFLKR